MAKADTEFGKFFQIDLAELFDIANKSGDVNCVLCMILIRRGQGAKANSRWSIRAIKNYLGISQICAVAAMNWLLGNGYITEVTTEKGFFVKRGGAKIADPTYLPDSLVNETRGKIGPLGNLMNCVVPCFQKGIYLPDAQCDAILLLMFFYKNYKQQSRGGVDPSLLSWHWINTPHIAKPNVTEKNSLTVLQAKKSDMVTDYEALRVIFGHDQTEKEMEDRIDLAIDNLRSAKLIYDSVTVSGYVPHRDSAKIVDDHWHLAYLVSHEYRDASTTAIPTLESDIAKYEKYLMSQSVLCPKKSNQYFVNYVGWSGQKYLVQSVISLSYIADNSDAFQAQLHFEKISAQWKSDINSNCRYSNFNLEIDDLIMDCDFP